MGGSTIADIVGELARTKAQAIPSNTERANDNGIRWFLRACAALGTPVDRPSPIEADSETVTFLHAYVVYYAALTAHTRPSPQAPPSNVHGLRRPRVI